MKKTFKFAHNLSDSIAKFANFLPILSFFSLSNISFQQQRLPNRMTRSETHFLKKCEYERILCRKILARRKNVISENIGVKMMNFNYNAFFRGFIHYGG